MKKLFTLVAFLACFLGANAQQWEEVYKIDYSTLSGFPNYPMGYVPEWINGVMTDFGADYRYATQDDLDGDGDAKLKDGESIVGTSTTSNGTVYQKVTGAGPYWHQYIIAADVPMIIDETYKVKAVVKASAAVNANLQFGNWGSLKETSVTIPEGSEFVEVEWDVEGCMFNGNGFICIQPGSSTATIEWQSLKVEHKLKANQRPKEWLEDIVNGDAEKPWGDLATVKFDDQENNFKICAWGKEKGVNMNEKDGWDPFPATIEAEEGNESNHVFVVHAQPATTEGDASAYDNQFWIQSQHAWKSGTQLKIHFRYKCNKASVKTNTQIHKQNPSDYLIWHAIGDVTFTDQWQTFDGTMTMGDDMANGWSIAFNLNPEVKEAVDFYFDDLSWQYLKLDEGYFVSGINSQTAKSYDNLDNAVEFVEGEDFEGAPSLIATVGEAGNAASYVDQIMISTTRGDDAAFKGATLNTKSKVKTEKEWIEYVASSNQRIDLPGLGVWKIYLDTEYNNMAFEMTEGTKYEQPDPVEIVTNATEFVVNAVERDWRGKDNDGNLIEEQEGTGQPWDNQFWIAANRNLQKGEVTILKFKYKSSIDAKTSTQAHKMGDDGKPCTYLNWQAIGDVNFAAGDWVDFENEFTIPEGDDGMRSVVFNMAEIKGACDYYIKDVQWYLKDENNAEGKTYENLINATGTENFWIKIKDVNESAPYQYGTDPTGINTIVAKKNGTAVIYNLAGQRVSKDYKGLVVKEGKKFAVK